MARLITRTMLVDHVKVKFYDNETDSIRETNLKVPDALGEKDWRKMFHETFENDTPVSFTLENQTEELVTMPRNLFYCMGTHKEVVKND